MKNRVVITGMGAVSPFGIGVEKLWRNLISGRSSIDLLDIDLDKNIYTPYGAQLKDFDFKKSFQRANEFEAYLDRAMQFVLVATCEAYKQANINKKDTKNERLGIYIGTTTAGHLSAYNQSKKRFLENKPFDIHNLYQCTPGAWPLTISKYVEASGPLKSFCVSCSAGGESIGNAFRDIRDGLADIIITGGGDAPISKINYLSFYLIKTTSRWKGNPSEACQPYSKDRPGMVFGEGAGILVLESLEHALNRGANILCEVVDYVANTDGYHIVAPEPNAIRYGEMISKIISDNNLTRKDIGYINCHGTGTRKNDIAETKAIKHAFKKDAYNLKISSIKSMIGHAFGGATALEVISLVKTLNENIVPPTINYKSFDEQCDLDCSPNKASKTDTNFGLKIATGFGGSNSK